VQAALLPPEAVQRAEPQRVLVQPLLVPQPEAPPGEPRHPRVATPARNEVHHVQQLRPERREQVRGSQQARKSVCVFSF